MPTVNLGFQVRDYSKMSPACCPEPTPAKEVPTKEAFPCMTIPHNKALAKAVTAGQEFTAVVKFRVSEVMMRDRADKSSEPYYDEYGGDTRVELQAMTMELQNIKVDESPEEDGKEAIANFFDKK